MSPSAFGYLSCCSDMLGALGNGLQEELWPLTCEGE